jgi:predicted nucleic-acid-binding Zn-ribbon protein
MISLLSDLISSLLECNKSGNRSFQTKVVIHSCHHLSKNTKILKEYYHQICNDKKFEKIKQILFDHDYYLIYIDFLEIRTTKKNIKRCESSDLLKTSN